MHNSNDTITNTLHDHTIQSDFNSLTDWFSHLNTNDYLIAGSTILLGCCYCISCCYAIHRHRRNARQHQRLPDNQNDYGHLLDTSDSQDKLPKQKSRINWLFKRNKANNKDDNQRNPEGSIDVRDNNDNNIILQQSDPNEHHPEQSCKSEGIPRFVPGGSQLI